MSNDKPESSQKRSTRSNSTKETEYYELGKRIRVNTTIFDLTDSDDEEVENAKSLPISKIPDTSKSLTDKSMENQLKKQTSVIKALQTQIENEKEKFGVTITQKDGAIRAQENQIKKLAGQNDQLKRDLVRAQNANQNPQLDPNQANDREINMAVTLSDAVNGISEFNGNEKNLESFINSCNLYNTIIPQANRDTLLAIIKSKIIGDAYNKVQPLENINNWDALKQRLRDKLKKTVSFEYAQQDLSTVSQQNKETVEQFGDKVKKKLRALNDATRSMTNDQAQQTILRSANEKLAIAKFEQNLKDESVRILTSAANKNSLDDVIAYAMQKELILKTKNPVKCDFCGMLNHEESSCRKKKAEEGKKSINKKSWGEKREEKSEAKRDEDLKPASNSSFDKRNDEKPFNRNGGKNGKNPYQKNIRSMENESDNSESENTIENAIEEEEKN